MITPKGNLSELTKAYKEAKSRFEEAILEYLPKFFATRYPNVPLYELIPQTGVISSHMIHYNGAWDWEGELELSADVLYYLPSEEVKKVGRTTGHITFNWGDEFGFQIK